MLLLFQGGLDKATALKVLKRWEETGATDPASLTKMLRRRSLNTVLAILVQAILDAGEHPATPAPRPAPAVHLNSKP